MGMEEKKNLRTKLTARQKHKDNNGCSDDIYGDDDKEEEEVIPNRKLIQVGDC